MQDFEYVVPHSIQEAVAALSRANGGARILAGGTDLLVQLREGRTRAATVVDIKQVPEVNELSFSPTSGLRIGSAVPCYLIADFCRDQGLYPGLRMAVKLIGGIQIQGRASVGGNLCNASPAADTIPALIVHHTICLIMGPEGTREVAAEDFCTAPGRTVLRAGEFLVSLQVPPIQAGFGAAYLRFTPRNEMDIAVAGAGASVELDERRSTILAARVALSAVAPTPLFVPEVGRYLSGRPVSMEAVREAARMVRDFVRPIDDMRGTAAQRKQLSEVLTRRALEAAIDQARSI